VTERLADTGRAVSKCELPLTAFEQISQGAVDESVITLLGKGQYSLRKLMLRALVDTVSTRGAGQGLFANVDLAWSILAEAERLAPTALRDVVMSPAVGVWLARALRAAVGDESLPLWAELGGLHTVAAAAAVRCGVITTVPVPVVHGTVALPTVGLFELPVEFPVGDARVHNSSDGMWLTALRGSVELRPDVPDNHFRSMRRHRTTAGGHTLDVAFDDFSPHRTFSSLKPPDPMAEADHEQWCKLLDEAWRSLTRWHPDYAEEIAACLTTIIPLPRECGVFASSSSAAFGGVAMSPKETSGELAEALVHELQHSKLNAAMDLVVLHRSRDDRWFYAPWRDDPRPLSGLLHGIYAFTSVIEFWHGQRDVLAPHQVVRADMTFGHRARQVSRALDILRRCGDLTDPGRELVAATSVRVAACDPANLPTAVARAIETMTADHYAVWRTRHVRPRPAQVDELVERWSAGEAADFAPEDGEVLPSGEIGESRRSLLVRTRLLDPYLFERLCGHRGPDVMFARGDRDDAARDYAKRIRTGPRSGDDWVGLGLSLGSRSILNAPETVRAVYLRAGGAPDPIELAAWLDGAAS